MPLPATLGLPQLLVLISARRESLSYVECLSSFPAPIRAHAGPVSARPGRQGKPVNILWAASTGSPPWRPPAVRLRAWAVWLCPLCLLTLSLWALSRPLPSLCAHRLHFTLYLLAGLSLEQRFWRKNTAWTSELFLPSRAGVDLGRAHPLPP